MDDRWLTIENFPDYMVTNLGEVWSLKRASPRLLKPWLHNSGGYPAVKLSRRGEKQETHLVHQLVCHAFHGPKPTVAHEVAHWDGDPENCRADNLRWALHVENHEDSVRHGTHSTSTQFQPTKLTDNQVREIRRLLGEDQLTQNAIAYKFGISQTMVSHIKMRRTRKHLR